MTADLNTPHSGGPDQRDSVVDMMVAIAGNVVRSCKCFASYGEAAPLLVDASKTLLTHPRGIALYLAAVEEVERHFQERHAPKPAVSFDQCSFNNVTHTDIQTVGAGGVGVKNDIIKEDGN